MDYIGKNKLATAADEISHLYIKRMSPSGRAKRHGLAQQPIEWPLDIYGVKARNLKAKDDNA
jgi:hypothetical protein